MSEALRQASFQLVKALSAGDLEAAVLALKEREEAIAAGGIATEEIIALGDQATALIDDLKRQAGFDAALLGQLRQVLPLDPAAHHIEVRG